MSNSLDPDEARRFVVPDLIWVQTVCQDYQQRTLVDKELIYKACIFLCPFLTRNKVKSYLRTIASPDASKDRLFRNEY